MRYRESPASDADESSMPQVHLAHSHPPHSRAFYGFRILQVIVQRSSDTASSQAPAACSGVTNMNRSLLLMLGLALSCGTDERECDAATEIEVLYGSDQVGKGPVTRCEMAPASCGDAPDCECLRGQMLANGLRLDFCLESGECDDEGDVVHVVCPGG